MELALIISGLFLLVMAVVLLMRKPASYDSDTTGTRNGQSYESSRTIQYDRYG